MAETEKISLPITIDYPLLRSLLVSQAFPETGETATLVNRGDGCTLLTTAQPQISESDGQIRFEVLVNARAGTPLGDSCFAPVEWQGYLVLYQQPLLDPETWQLSFSTVSSEVLRKDRQPAKIATILWNMIEPRVTSHLAGIVIDLLPPISQIKGFLLPLFPDEHRKQTEHMLASMQPSELMVNPQSLHFAIATEVESVFEPDSHSQNQYLSQEDLQHVVAIWERWDSFLVYVITALSKKMLNENEKHLLINILLDMRHHFVRDMTERTIQNDIVRQQFVRSWQVMSPIFRRHLLQGESASQALGYLAFVASADALLVFDKLGPTFGLEISTKGLVRLMHMLDADPNLLQYHPGINPDLQQHFEIEDPQPQAPPSSSSLESPNNSSFIRLFLSQLTPREAFAAATQPQFSEIIQWKVPKSDVSTYVKKVEGILRDSTTSVIRSGEIPKIRQEMFRQLIPALAWQESCFRQFVVKGKKLTYLISYNQSSVGLMQVNERVWRGLYDLGRLRWDIHYNAHVGSAIAVRYLNRYVLNDTDKASSIDDDTLARLIYAMYNGGPSQYKKFFQRLKKQSLYDSDKLFWEKYLLVKANKVEQVSVCLVGS